MIRFNLILFILFIFLRVNAQDDMFYLLTGGPDPVFDNATYIYPFELDNSTVCYEVNENNNGVNSNVTIQQTGKVESYANTYVASNSSKTTFSTPFISSFPFSVSFWVKIQTGNVMRLCTHVSNVYRGFWVEVSGSNIQLNFGNGGGTGSTSRRSYIHNKTFSNNTWYHVVITATSYSSKVVYVDGSTVSQFASSGTATSVSFSNGYSSIGLNTLESGYSDGTIDQLVWFNVELSSSQVSTLYNSGNGLAYEK